MFSVTLYVLVIAVSLGPPLIVLETGVASFTEIVTLTMVPILKGEESDRKMKTVGRNALISAIVEMKVIVCPPEAE